MITVKFGSDLVVSKNGLNHSFLESICVQQKIARERWNAQFLIVTSGAGKLGRIIGNNQGFENVSKQEAAFKGFDAVMNGWSEMLHQVGTDTARLALTGHDLTKSRLRSYKTMIEAHANITFLINTHDGLNASMHRYQNEAANNDVVGERFAMLSSDLYIICTNVDGVYDKYGEIVRVINDMRVLNEIKFGKKSDSGSGGMETKLHSAIRFAKSKKGRVSYIVNGNEKDILLKVLAENNVGTRIQFKE